MNPDHTISEQPFVLRDFCLAAAVPVALQGHAPSAMSRIVL